MSKPCHTPVNLLQPPSEGDGFKLKAPLQILHLEDDLRDAALLEAVLDHESISCKIVVARSREEFVKALGQPELDLIVSDFSMPGFDGLSALNIARIEKPEIPFIFLSGTIGEELAVQVLREGATDYVLKDRMARLPAAICRALAEVEAKKQRCQNEAQLRHQAALLDLAQDAICLNDMNQAILYWNNSAERLYGWSAKEALGRNANDLLFQGDMHGPLEALKSLIRKGTWQGELHQVTKDEKKIIVESRWTLMRNEREEAASILIINTDITEKKQLEYQFLRTQRMETIGALAGGIAHDLNNSLTPVLMALSMLRSEMLSEESVKLLATARASAARGVEMIRQILSFSRGVAGAHSLLQVQPLLDEISRLAEDTFPPSIRIQTLVQPDLFPIKGNATQIHQVLLNLCVNARDAMPAGGCLTMQASNITLEEMDRRPGQQTSGPYVLLTVHDTGVGMTPEVLARVFDPFFTTKEIGKGTGLGLSTVMGIVKTHGGFVEVSSAIDEGSLFRVFLPAAARTEPNQEDTDK